MLITVKLSFGEQFKWNGLADENVIKLKLPKSIMSDSIGNKQEPEYILNKILEFINQNTGVRPEKLKVKNFNLTLKQLRIEVDDNFQEILIAL